MKKMFLHIKTQFKKHKIWNIVCWVRILLIRSFDWKHWAYDIWSFNLWNLMYEVYICEIYIYIYMYDMISYVSCGLVPWEMLPA